jgi:methylenetetrahydrofolate--tRNA-(uracil-5-)-methyltransferase
LIAGRNAAARVLGWPTRVPPRTTAIGALAYYVSHANPAHYQPTNITFGIIAPLPHADASRWKGAGHRPAAERRARGGAGPRASKKATRNEALSERALADLDAWMKSASSQEVVPTT